MTSCEERNDKPGNIEPYITLWLLHNEHTKTDGPPIIFDTVFLREELMRFVNEPLCFDDVINMLEAERHINVFPPTLSCPNAIVKLDPLNAYEFTLHKESEGYIKWFKRAEANAGRTLSEDDFFGLGYPGAQECKLMVAHDFFVSFIPELRDYDGMKAYKAMIIDNE